MGLQALQSLQLLGEALNVLFGIGDHGGPLGEVNALRAESVSIFEEILQLLVLGVQIVEHKVFVLDDLYEIVKSDTLLVKFFNIILNKVFQIITILNAQVHLEFLDSMIKELEEKYRIELRKKAILKNQCD